MRGVESPSFTSRLPPPHRLPTSDALSMGAVDFALDMVGEQQRYDSCSSCQWYRSPPRPS
jgi:hypothetical protein